MFAGPLPLAVAPLEGGAATLEADGAPDAAALVPGAPGVPAAPGVAGVADPAVACAEGGAEAVVGADALPPTTVAWTTLPVVTLV